MLSAAAAFVLVAGVIGFGYLGGRIMAGTRFPDVALLLGLGLLLGPLNRTLVAHGLGLPSVAAALAPERLALVRPYMSGLALAVILFDAGLGLQASAIRRSFGPAVRIMVPMFFTTAIAIACIGRFVFGMPWMVAFILGVALCNVGQTVSSTLLRRLQVDDQTRAIGMLEMALYDLVSVPVLVALFLLAAGSALGGASQVQESLSGLAQTVSISLLIGGGAGLAWAGGLRRLEGHPHSYMLTLAVLLAVYGGTELLGGAGAVSVLLFGLCVSNRAALLRLLFRLRPRGPGEEEKVQEFHEEVSFLIRTVFFLFLGASFTIGLQDHWPVHSGLPGLAAFSGRAALFGLGAALVLVAIPLARALVIPAVAGKKRAAWVRLVPIFGHGLGTAALATLPFVWRDYHVGTPYYELLSPWQPVFVNLALLVVLGTVLGSSVAVFWMERHDPPTAKSNRETISASRPLRP